MGIMLTIRSDNEFPMLKKVTPAKYSLICNFIESIFNTGKILRCN